MTEFRIAVARWCGQATPKLPRRGLRYARKSTKQGDGGLVPMFGEP